MFASTFNNFFSQPLPPPPPPSPPSPPSPPPRTYKSLMQLSRVSPRCFEAIYGSAGSALNPDPIAPTLAGDNCDYSGYDMRGLDLMYGNFAHSCFTNSDLSNVNFGHAMLEDTSFNGAILHGADFESAHLEAQPRAAPSPALRTTPTARLTGERLQRGARGARQL
jgi:hypothetical protein